MKNLLRYTTALLVISMITACFNAKKINNKLAANAEYGGWYIGSAYGHYFVIDRKGLFKKSIAFALNEFPRFCPGQAEAIASFMNLTPCEKNKRNKNGFLHADRSDISFGQGVSIFKARAFYNGFDTTYMEQDGGDRRKLLFKMKAATARFTIRATGLEGAADLRNLVLFSNCNQDSLNYFGCPSRKNQ